MNIKDKLINIKDWLETLSKASHSRRRFLSFAGKTIALSQIPTADLPTRVQTLIPQLVNDVLSPLQIFSLGCLIAGVVLIIVSHTVKARKLAS